MYRTTISCLNRLENQLLIIWVRVFVTADINVLMRHADRGGLIIIIIITGARGRRFSRDILGSVLNIVVVSRRATTDCENVICR